MRLFDRFKRRRTDGLEPSIKGQAAVSQEIWSTEVITVEERIRTAFRSSHGLFPHEVLMLDYVGRYSTGRPNSFPGFWWYRYGVRDPEGVLQSLLMRGFIRAGDLRSAIDCQNTTTLKDELKKHGLRHSGRKADLVNRLLEEVPSEELNARFPNRRYQLTALGEQTLAEEDYVPYIHRKQCEDLDIWSLNRLVHTPPDIPYRDKIWAHLNKRSGEHFAARNFGMYRNCRLSMFHFLGEEDRTRDALLMLAEVVFYDLSGLHNGYDPRLLSIWAEHFFPYKESSATIAPGVISHLTDCQDRLGLPDGELRGMLLQRMSRLRAPFHLFTPEQCVDIVYLEMHQDERALTAMYAVAERRFKEKWPTLRR